MISINSNYRPIVFLKNYFALLIISLTCILYQQNIRYGGDHMNDIITEVRVFPKDNLGKTLGFANITLLDKFVVKNLRIVKGDKGIFIGMPSNKRKNGEYIDLFFPITQEARDLITSAIIDKYNELMNTSYPVENKVKQ